MELHEDAMAADGRTQDAIALLTADHRRMEALFAEYDKARAGGRKRQLVVAICTELTIHAIVEEELLYPACRPMLGDATFDEINEDREAAATMVADLLGEGPHGERYDDMVADLRAHLGEHVRAEEGAGGLFERLRASGIDLLALGRRMWTRRRHLLGDLEQVGFVAAEARSFQHEGGPQSAFGEEDAPSRGPREPRTLM